MGKKSQQRRAMWPLREGREIWGVDGAFASMTWRRHCVRDGVAPSANELAWFYMGSRLGHAEAFPKRSTQCWVTYERELFWTYTMVKSLYSLKQWFSKCGTWDFSSGTQRNLRIKYKSVRVSTKAIFLNCFKWERLFHAEHSGVFSWHREFKNVSTHHCHFLVS